MNLTRVLHGFVLPIVALFPIAGNSLIIVAYWKQCYKGSRMKRASNVFLISICASYLTVPLVSCPWNVFAYTFRNLELSITLKLCYVWYIFKMIPIIPHTGALILTCVLSFQRFTAIRYPLKANLWWTYKKALVIVFVVYCIILPIHIVLLLAVKVSKQNLEEGAVTNTTNYTHIDCVSYISYSEYTGDPKTFGISWMITRNLFLGTLPSIILLYVVIITIKTLRRRYTSENKLKKSAVVIEKPEQRFPVEGKNEANSYSKNRYLTIPTRVILSMAMTEIVMNTISNVCILIDCLSFATNDLVLYRSAWISVVRPISTVILFIGANSMFFYSCFMNKEFKMALRRLLHA